MVAAIFPVSLVLVSFAVHSSTVVSKESCESLITAGLQQSGQTMSPEFEGKLQSKVWEDIISDEVEELLILADKITSVPWTETRIPNESKYFSDPSPEIFAEMSKQLYAILFAHLIEVVRENNAELASDTPNVITKNSLHALRDFVNIILSHYLAVDYHSSEHALHVTLNANKLMSFILGPDKSGTKIRYGIQASSLTQFAFMFSALIHDAKHLGVSNHALTMEEHELAILYNDQSMLEQQSLTIAFREFLKPEYSSLRNLIFAPDYNGMYNKFRRLVVDLVLCTDIASPERMQLTKSKFKEAFGETFKKRLSTASPAARRGSRTSKASIVSESSTDFGSENDGWLSLSSSSSEDDDDSEPEPRARVFSTRKLDGGEDNTLSEDDLTSSDEDDDDQNEGNEKGETENLRTSMTNMNFRSLPSSRAKSIANFSARSGVRNSNLSGRHSSLPTNFFQSKTYRLGIRVALDFTGLAVTRFPDGEEKKCKKMEENKEESKGTENQDDPLKAQVVLELMIRAADVGSTMQSFANFSRWGSRLFFEYKKANEVGRGFDPESSWLNGQIGFLDAYAKQLAKSMEDSLVFGEENNIFVQAVEENKKQWKQHGANLMSALQEDWLKERERIQKEETPSS